MTSRKRRRTMSFTVSRSVASMVVAAGAFASLNLPVNGQDRDTKTYIASKPVALQPAFNALVQGGARDSVLNNMEITSVALKIGDYAEAGDAIDRALLDINKYYGHTEEAARARSLWHEEGAKSFKGEPYERAMANYYRGMLDLAGGDFDNARASFDNGFLQDAFAEEEQHRSDFALLAFLAGWAADRAGSVSLADERYAELELLRKDFVRPPGDHDTLVVIETGKSPRKLADGIGHGELVYRRGKKFPERSALVGVGDGYRAYPMEDIFLQASTRGGRPVDRILDGKIKFQKTYSARGSVLTDAADVFADTAFLTESQGLNDIATGLSVVGSLSMMMAQNAKPRADTRYWSGLPDGVHVFTYSSSEHPVSQIPISFLDQGGNEIPEIAQTATRYDDGQGSGLVWAISQ